MFAALITAWKARAWLGYAVAGLGGFLLAAALIGAPAYFMVKGSRDTAQAAIQRADMASQDAARWHRAAEDRRAALERQKAETARLVKDHEDTRQAAFDLVEQAEARAAETERRLTKLRKEGADAPLNDTARAAADYGLCRTKAILAGTDPASC